MARCVLLTGGVMIFGILPGIFYQGSHLGLIHPYGNPELMNHRGFVLQVMLLTAAGLHQTPLTGLLNFVLFARDFVFQSVQKPTELFQPGKRFGP